MDNRLSINFQTNRLREFSLAFVKAVKVVDTQFEYRSDGQDVGRARTKLGRSLAGQLPSTLEGWTIDVTHLPTALRESANQAGFLSPEALPTYALSVLASADHRSRVIWQEEPPKYQTEFFGRYSYEDRRSVRLKGQHGTVTPPWLRFYLLSRRSFRSRAAEETSQLQTFA